LNHRRKAIASLRYVVFHPTTTKGLVIKGIIKE
jgi:hypothetical protein